MVIFEQIFKDTTGIRIVTLPNESIEREETVVQLRIKTGPERNAVKLVKCALTDEKTGEDLYPLLEKAILQVYLKRVGEKCENCESYYMATSPNQRQCR